MHKQCVFLVNTAADGTAEVLSPVRLSGKLKSITYITDNRVPFDDNVGFAFSSEGGNAVLMVESVTGRATWTHEDGLEGELKNERIKVAVVGGGKGKSGSFVVTTE